MTKIENLVISAKIMGKSAARAVGLEVRRRHVMPFDTLMALSTKSIRTVFDVGSNEGQFAAHALKVLPEATVYGFEPLPATFALLQAFASKSGGRLIPCNYAIGDAEGSVQMYQDLDHSTSSSLLRSTPLNHAVYPLTRRQGAVTVALTTLDSFVAQLPRPPADDFLVKVDAQGYEGFVVRGGVRTFARARACILEINLDPMYERQASFKELFTAMDGFGLEYRGNLEQACAEDGHVIFLDAVFVRP